MNNMRNLVLVALIGLIALTAIIVIGMVVLAAIIDGSTAHDVITNLYNLGLLSVPVILSVVQYYIHAGTQDPAPVTPAVPVTTPAGGGPAAASTDPLSGAA